MKSTLRERISFTEVLDLDTTPRYEDGWRTPKQIMAEENVSVKEGQFRNILRMAASEGKVERRVCGTCTYYRPVQKKGK